MCQREEIIAKIAEEELKVLSLRVEHEAAAERLNKLREELASLASGEEQVNSALDSPSQAPSPTSNQEKVSLFRSLFRGREDVFPLRWENPRTGKSGYSPACKNEWKKGSGDL
jgi:hypothetical protein